MHKKTRNNQIKHGRINLKKEKDKNIHISQLNTHVLGFLLTFGFTG